MLVSTRASMVQDTRKGAGGVTAVYCVCSGTGIVRMKLPSATGRVLKVTLITIGSFIVTIGRSMVLSMSPCHLHAYGIRNACPNSCPLKAPQVPTSTILKRELERIIRVRHG